MPESTVNERLREALLELHSAGLALAPHLGYIDAGISVRWDDAMGAADDLLKLAFDEEGKP